VELHLDPAEAAELRRLLTAALGDLSQEIADTDNASFRRELREQRERLQVIEQKLEAG
jgi:hypothetical protein